MPKNKSRMPTDQPGVFYQISKTGERQLSIRYRRGLKMYEEPLKPEWFDEETTKRYQQIYRGRLSPKFASWVRERREKGGLNNAEMRAQLESLKRSETAKITITKLWDIYKESNPELKGIVTDENRFQKHIRPTFGDREPKNLCPMDVEHFRISLQKNRRPATVRNVLELLRRIVNFGVNKHLCEGYTFPFKLPGKLNNEKTEDLTPKQLSALLQALDEEPNIQAANLMRLALFTGMRRGELFRLEWNHINFDRGFITIVTPKGGKDQSIPLNDAARKILDNHPHYGESPFVFPGRRGDQRTDITKAVNAIKQKAGIPKDFRALHGLRHTYASMLASSGEVDLYTIQKLLTHKSPAMTQRYSHLRDEALQKAAAVASHLIEQATEGEWKK